MRNSIKFILSLGVFLLLSSCKDEGFPKPKSFLYLEYTEAEYQRFINNCPYSFAISKESQITFKDNCDAFVIYPKLKASVHITYRGVNNNLQLILSEADKLTSKHTLKADAIIPHPFANPEKRVYGLLNEVQGEGASNVQFYVTDSIRHVLTAALYFEVAPNYDSLFPAIDYIKNDMMKMMETMEWKK